MAPYMTLPAAHLRPSPLSLSFVPSIVHETFDVRLSGFCDPVHLNTCCDLACLVNQSLFNDEKEEDRCSIL